MISEQDANSADAAAQVLDLEDGQEVIDLGSERLTYRKVEKGSGSLSLIAPEHLRLMRLTDQQLQQFSA